MQDRTTLLHESEFCAVAPHWYPADHWYLGDAHDSYSCATWPTKDAMVADLKAILAAAEASPWK